MEAASTSQVQRSAWAGWRGRGVVQPRVCLQNLTVCSRSKRRMYARQARSRSSGTPAGPAHHNHSTFGGRARLGGDVFDLDADDGAAHDRAGCAAAVAGVALLLGCSPAQAATVTVPYWSS